MTAMIKGAAQKLMSLVKAAAKEVPAPRRLDLALGERGVTVTWPAEAHMAYELSLFTEGHGFTYFKNQAPGAVLPVVEGNYRLRVRVNGGGQVSGWSPEVFFLIALSAHTGQMELRTARKRGVVPRPEVFHRNVALIREEISRGKTSLESFPVALSLILEGRGCNFKCFYCSHIIEDAHMLLGPENTFTKGFTFERGQILRINRVDGQTVGAPAPLMDQIRENLPKVCTVMFGGSEPLLYPEFADLVAVTQDYPHVQCSVCTNGSLLHEELAERIVKSNFPWIRVSIDGATPRTFKKIRKGKFEKVINNIKRLIELRGENAWPKVQFNFVVCRSNYHEIPLLVDLAAEVGVSLVNYKMLISHPGELGRAFVSEDPLSDRGLCVEIIDLMKQAADRAQARGVMLSKEAVTPAIFARHPDLADPIVQDSLRRSEAAAIAGRARLRAEEPDDDPGPQPLAEFAKTLDEWHLVAVGGKYHGKAPEEIAALTEDWEVRTKREMTRKALVRKSGVQRSAVAQDSMLTTLLEDEDASMDEDLDACVAPAKVAGKIDWPNVFCDLPFTNISVGHNKAKFCCYAKQPFTVFYAGDDLTLQDIWNNPKFVEAREAMYAGEAARVCKPTCPHLRYGGVKNKILEED